MKRNYIPFIAGMSTMLLLVGLVGASLAGETRPPAVPQSGTLNGQVAYGEAGVALFGKEQVPAGAAWTTEDGAQIPTVLTYTDENGGGPLLHQRRDRGGGAGHGLRRGVPGGPELH